MNTQQENTKINISVNTKYNNRPQQPHRNRLQPLQLRNSKRGNKLSNHGSRTEQAVATYSGTAAKEEMNSATTAAAQKQAVAATALHSKKEETNSAKQQSYTKKRK